MKIYRGVINDEAKSQEISPFYQERNNTFKYIEN